MLNSEVIPTSIEQCFLGSLILLQMSTDPVSVCDYLKRVFRPAIGKLR